MSSNTEPRSVPGEGDSSVQTASTSVLSFVGGKDENQDDRNSVFPDDSEPQLGIDLPADDTLFYGDATASLPETLVEAASKTKTVDGLDGSFNKFRFKNTIQVRYDTTTDGKVKNDSVVITVNSQKDGDTVEITDNTSSSITSFSATQNLILPDDPDQPSYTILADDWKDKIPWYVEPYPFDKRKRRGKTYPRYVKAEKDVFQAPDGSSVEGIRAATIWGGSNPYTAILTGPSNIPLIDGRVQDNPIIYHWIELTLLTDGTTYIRLPDASVFPRHVGYLRGPLSDGESTKRTTSGLTYILDETVDTADDTYDVAIREKSNNVWSRFKKEFEQNYVVPYKTGNTLYYWSYDTVDLPLYDHPVMVYGEASDGTELSQDDVLNQLPEDPLFPMPNGPIKTIEIKP